VYPTPDHTHQWLFVNAFNANAARETAEQALLSKEWVYAYQVGRPVFGRHTDFSAAVDTATRAQQRNLVDLAADIAAASDPIDLLAMAIEHDPRYTGVDVDRVASMAMVAQILAGFWTPWSGGVDVTTGRADYSTAINRHLRTPHHQWAVPVLIQLSDPAGEALWADLQRDLWGGCDQFAAAPADSPSHKYTRA